MYVLIMYVCIYITGNVIQMIDEKVDPTVVKAMVYGSSDPLYSSYKVGYNMVLNMLRVEDADPENILRCSFLQYQQETNTPALQQKVGRMLACLYTCYLLIIYNNNILITIILFLLLFLSYCAI